MNSVGIAIIAMLLGSNIGYAIDNYGILVNNLSFAEPSSTDDPDKPTGNGREEPDSGWYGTDENNEVVADVDKCDMSVYTRRQVPYWEQRVATSYFESTSEWSMEVGLKSPESQHPKQIIISNSSFSYKKEKGKMVKVCVTYERPTCVNNNYNCCERNHWDKDLIYVSSSAGLDK